MQECPIGQKPKYTRSASWTDGLPNQIGAVSNT